MSDYKEAFGPNALGHTPLIGEIRRQNELPVLRDEASEQLNDLDAVNLPENPILPILNLD